MIVSKKGKKYYYYINIASPFLIEEDVIKYIDFDLDYRIPDARSAKINLLDVDEFNEHQIKYKYPKNLVDKLNQVKHEILEKFKQKKFDQYLNYALIYKRSNEVNHDKTK
jgi:protein associated with RNAse G/E